MISARWNLICTVNYWFTVMDNFMCQFVPQGTLILPFNVGGVIEVILFLLLYQILGRLRYR